uniref:Uncharacterized protein n=1 Tax=Lotus japonicus TaxID=34305 RepID=I3SSR6_LOTJA|nr:unknown [Lotus japonicus]
MLMGMSMSTLQQNMHTSYLRMFGELL